MISYIFRRFYLDIMSIVIGESNSFQIMAANIFFSMYEEKLLIVFFYQFHMQQATCCFSRRQHASGTCKEDVEICGIVI